MNANKNSPGMMGIFARIADERIRQRQLQAAGKFKYTCASAGISDDIRLKILTEELGEVAREVCEGCPVLHPGLTPAQRRRIQKKLRTELVQVAAVCVAWLETPEVEP